MKKNKKTKIFIISILISTPLFLSGCSIGNIKLVEKIEKPKPKVNYGKLKNNNSEENSNKTAKDKIKYNKDSDIVCSADGYVFKKEDFVVSVLKNTYYFERPDSSNSFEVKMGTSLSVVGVSDDDKIYMIKLEEDKFGFIKAEDCAKDEKQSKKIEEEKNKEKEKEEKIKKEAEKQKAEEDKKRKENEEKAKKEAEKKAKFKAEEDKKKLEEKKAREKIQNALRKQNSPKTNNQNSSTPQSKPHYYSSPQQISSNSSNSQNTSTNESKPSTENRDLKSNIRFPNSRSYENVYGVRLARSTMKVKVISNDASLNSAPGEPIEGSNVYSLGYLNVGDIFDITGITENGYVRVSGPDGLDVFINGAYLTEY